MISVKYTISTNTMETILEKSEIIRQLREKIMGLEGFSKSSPHPFVSFGLGPLEAAFPGNVFPTGTIHEFISQESSSAASTNGFIAGLLGLLTQRGGYCLWVSHRRSLFPHGLKYFGLAPDRLIFVDVPRKKDILWVLEQGLKCPALTAVVGELQELSFTESQRLQLAVERSKVTGFIHRCQPRQQHALACATRWKITPRQSELEEGMPGLGHPSWRVELLKVRNGRPGNWLFAWENGRFRHLPSYQIPIRPGISTGSQRYA